MYTNVYTLNFFFCNISFYIHINIISYEIHLIKENNDKPRNRDRNIKNRFKK